MKLADFTPATKEVPVLGGREQITVRGLNLTDLTLILTVYSDMAQEAADMVGKVIEDQDTQDIEAVIIRALQHFPVLSAHIIAVACGDAADLEQAAKLPFPTQLALLQAAFEMTFIDVGGIKNFVASLLKIAETAGVRLPPAMASGLARWRQSLN